MRSSSFGNVVASNMLPLVLKRNSHVARNPAIMSLRRSSPNYCPLRSSSPANFLELDRINSNEAQSLGGERVKVVPNSLTGDDRPLTAMKFDFPFKVWETIYNFQTLIF